MRGVIAVDLGATRTRVALVGDGGTVHRRIEEETRTDGGSPGSIAASLIALVRRLLHEQGGAEVDGIGVSAAGPVDIARGVVTNPPNIPVREIPVVGPLTKAFDLPVHLVNDCHAGLLGEMQFGIGRGRDNVVYITISTGIGGGVIDNGRILLGRGGNAAEIGHFVVDTKYGMECGCGHTGHWEGYASGRFLPRFFGHWCRIQGERRDTGFTNAEGIFAAATGGDPRALAFMEELGRINAKGISNVIVAYDPSLIVLDGAVARMNRRFIIPPILEHVDRFLPMPEMLVTALDGDAPLLGASLVARGYDTSFGSFRRPRSG
ncbi:MAG: ROK family protein [Methanomicrobiales archaeon]|nr:ROK family protein [Methanomicrobiales archaeon]